MKLIDELKTNERVYTRMSDEMKAAAEAIPWKYFLVWGYIGNVGGWVVPATDSFRGGSTYRLRADYTPPVEDGYELCEIYESGGVLRFNHKDNNPCLHLAVNHPNFAGYLYEDGKVSAMQVRYKSTANANTYPNLPMKWFEAGTVEILRPTHVVFKK